MTNRQTKSNKEYPKIYHIFLGFFLLQLLFGLLSWGLLYFLGSVSIFNLTALLVYTFVMGCLTGYYSNRLNRD